MKTKTRLLYMLLLFLALSSCKENSSLYYDSEGYQPVVSDITDIEGVNDTYGRITDAAGAGIADVVVSDGYVFALTDEKGIYQFKRNPKALFVFYANPSGYELATETVQNKMGLFYRKLNVNQKGRIRNDFKLAKAAADQTKFAIIGIGDPQVANADEVSRFKEETIVDMKETLAALGMPAIGISLGDVVADQAPLLASMKAQFGGIGMPLMTTVGNHDKFLMSSDGVKDGTTFSNIFGPLTYSFNYGDVHFICMDNVLFTGQANANYNVALPQEQIDWIARDLSYVPKEKMIVLYYHMPLRGTAITNKTALFDLLRDYKEVHLMAGHTHYNQNYIHTAPREMYEHIHAATCGVWWKSNINGDGTPNGYAVYTVDGSTIDNWYYKSVNFDKSHQMRLHRGNASFGGTHSTHTYNRGSDVIIANIWNADERWKIEVFENGSKTGEMSKSALTTDAWSLGYHLGVLNRDPANYTTTTTHLYQYTLVNPNAQVRVVATDSFGNIYEQSTLTTDLLPAYQY